MTTYYVDSSIGDDSNDGSSGSPWATLTKAAATIVANDTVSIAASTTYTESSLTWSKPATIVSTPAIPFVGLDRSTLPSVTATSGATVMNFSGFGPWTVQGIRIVGAGITTGINASSSSGAVIHISDCSFTGATFRQLALRNASTCIRTTFRDSTDAYGVYVAGGSDTYVGSCEFSNIGGAAVYHISAATAIVENCTFYRTCSSTTFWNYPVTSTLATVRNCLSVDNHSKYGGAAAWTYTNSWSSDSGTYQTSGNWLGSQDVTSQSDDPIFLDTGSDDFRLDAASPCLLAGSTTTATHLADGSVMPGTPPQGAYAEAAVPPSDSSWNFSEGNESCQLINKDFLINTMACKKNDYNRSLDAIPFGAATIGPISLRKRNIPYQVTK